MLTARQVRLLKQNIDVRAAVRLVLREQADPAREPVLEPRFAAAVARLLEVDADLVPWVRSQRTEFEEILAEFDVSSAELGADEEQVARRRAQAEEFRNLAARSEATQYGVRDAEVERQAARKRHDDVVPVFSDRRFGVVEDIVPPLAARRFGSKTIEYFSTVADFTRHLGVHFWPIAILDLDYVEGMTRDGALVEPFMRRDIVDILAELPDLAWGRHLLALMRDPHDLRLQLRLAEAMLRHPSIVGAIHHPSQMPRAFAAISADSQFWAGVPQARIATLRKFVEFLETPRKNAWWARHLLVAAAAGHVGPGAVIRVLPYSYERARNANSEVGTVIREVFRMAGPGQATEAIVSAARAWDPGIWTWARRLKYLFEPGFLDAMRHDAFPPPPPALRSTG